MIRFTRGTFTRGSRTIPILNLGRIDNWSVTDGDGIPYTLATSEGQENSFTIEQSGGEYKLRWFFPALRNESATYVIQYKVHDALRFYDGGDQVWWKAIFGNRPFPVEAGEVRVILNENASEQAARILEWAAYINGADARERATAQLAENQQEITFQIDRLLDAGEEFEVRVEFANGFAAGEVQLWQKSADAVVARLAEEAIRQAELEQRSAILGLLFGGLGLLFALGGLAGLYMLWYNHGRDKPVEMVADYLPEPPDDLPAGMVGTLLDERVDLEDIIATLVDLAQKGVLTITEKELEGHWGMESDFRYKLVKPNIDSSLRSYEQSLLKAVFGQSRKAYQSELNEKFYTHLPSLKREMYEAVTEEGLFEDSPQDVRSVWIFFSVVLLGLAVLTGYVLINTFAEMTDAAIFPALGIGVTSIVMMILSNFMPRKSDEGAERAARWQAFRRYLKNIDQYTEMNAQKDIWDRWLPYAVAFGFEEELIYKFEAVGAPAPEWYDPSPDDSSPNRRRNKRNKKGYQKNMPVTMDDNSSVRGTIQGTIDKGGRLGGDLGRMSHGLGSSLTDMSYGLGKMLSTAGSAMTSKPMPEAYRGDSFWGGDSDRSSSSDWSDSSGWSGSSSSGGSGFSGGGSSGGGGSGGGSGDFG